MTTTVREQVLDGFRWIGGHADVWHIFRDPAGLAAVVAGLVEPFREAGVTAVCGIESRGFLLGGAAAIELGVGFLPVRKGDGLLPGEKLIAKTEPDYRGNRHALRMQRSAVAPSDRIVLIDDWIETGNQLRVVKDLVEQSGATWVGSGVIVDDLGDRDRSDLGRIHALLRADELPPENG